MSRVGRRESQILSARLYPDNVDEKRALNVFNRLKKGGMNGSQIITAALLALGEHEIHTTDETTEILQGVVSELAGIIKLLNTNGSALQIDNTIIEQTNELSDTLKNSIKNRAQAGISLDKG